MNKDREAYLEKQAGYLYSDILSKVCRRAIAVMNKKLRHPSLSGGDFPYNFTFFDQFSVLIQSISMDEMGYPSGMLEDYISDVLEKEGDRVSDSESFVISYCLHPSEDERCEFQSDLMKRFLDMANDHYSLKKIQSYLERRGF